MQVPTRKEVDSNVELMRDYTFNKGFATTQILMKGTRMTMKRFICFLMTLVMCMALSISSFATEREREVIEISNEEEIMEFINSPEYDPCKLYSFVQDNPCAARSLCPSCGGNSYKGKTITENISVKFRGCAYGPSAPDDPLRDIVSVWGKYACAKCDKCLYITGLPYPSETYYTISCVTRTGLPDFVAKDGNTAPPCDVHEVKDT